jgi:methylenetetrahydrofolate--tRNA-(uracil-5-)-methyltransferase
MDTKVPPVIIIGGGLAGCEAAWQVLRRGIKVLLYEMRPHVMTPVHKTGLLAELVCSNSLGAGPGQKAPGLLKEELQKLDSLIIQAALSSSVPAGQALAVDRTLFSTAIEKKLLNHPLMEIRREEIREIPSGRPVIVATGPMTSPAMAESLKEILGSDYLYFFDAVSPVVSLESLDLTRIFRASRYGKGEQEYLNCPMSEEEYAAFLEALLASEKVKNEEYEEKFFEGCLPVEEIASRGPDTLRFGPMKPVGLMDPRTDIQPYAVVQLRQENREGSLYNLVGFQTRLKWPEQKRVFRLIPGLAKAEFLRLGVMHRNLFINAPACLEATGNLRSRDSLFIAGQISGVEGYMESTVSGALCGINTARRIQGREALTFPVTTATGALMAYISGAECRNFQPTNVNFGLFPALKERIKNKTERNTMIRTRALADLEFFLKEHEPS